MGVRARERERERVGEHVVTICSRRLEEHPVNKESRSSRRKRTVEQADDWRESVREREDEEERGGRKENAGRHRIFAKIKRNIRRA